MTIWEELLRTPDRLLWERLRRTDRTVVLYGTGNGADKILAVCREKGIPVRGVFASDGFRQGKLYQGMTVESRQAIFDRCGRAYLTVLLAFGSARPEVLDAVRALMDETELLVPDVPAFGDGLFDADFVRRHLPELLAARALLADDESRRIFDLTVAAKLTGEAGFLFDAVSDRSQVLRADIRPETIRTALDLGAYTGDTVRELLDAGATPERIFAVEPDARTFRKLTAYAAAETRTAVIPVRAAAWDRTEPLTFTSTGNRGATLDCPASPAARTVEIPGRTGDDILGAAHADYIKFDVEGAEARALAGLARHITADAPTLAVSVYHRCEDLFALPLLIRARFPSYRDFRLRRAPGLPAWDLELVVR